MSDDALAIASTPDTTDSPSNPAQPLQTQNIPIHELKENKWNRKYFEPKAMEDLIESIKACGIRDRLIVRPIQEGMGDPAGQAKYEIVSGNRRWEAAKAIGLADVPCEVRPMTDLEVQEHNLVMNWGRQDISAIEKARMLNSYMAAAGLTQEQLAMRQGIARTTVTELLGFLELPLEFLEHSVSPTLSYRTLKTLRSIKDSGIQLEVCRAISQGSLDPKDIKKKVWEMRSVSGTSSENHVDASTFSKHDFQSGGGSEFFSVPRDTEIENFPDSDLIGDAIAGDSSTAAEPTSSLLMGIVKALLVAFMAIAFYQMWPMLKQWYSGHHASSSTASSAPVAAVSKLGKAEGGIAMRFARPPVIKDDEDEPGKLGFGYKGGEIPVPAGLEAEVFSPMNIRLTWENMGAGYRYNVYSSATPDMINPRKENGSPILKSTVLWSPGTARTSYWVAVAAVDELGHGSTYSKPVLIRLAE